MKMDKNIILNKINNLNIDELEKVNKFLEDQDKIEKDKIEDKIILQEKFDQINNKCFIIQKTESNSYINRYIKITDVVIDFNSNSINITGDVIKTKYVQSLSETETLYYNIKKDEFISQYDIFQMYGYSHLHYDVTQIPNECYDDFYKIADEYEKSKDKRKEDTISILNKYGVKK